MFFLKKIALYVLTILAGASLTAAFAPFDIWPLAIICPALLLIFWQGVSAKQAFVIGILFGLGFFGTGVSWVYVSLYDYGQASEFLAGLLTFLTMLVLSSYIALVGYVLNRYFQQRTAARYLLAFPSLWVLAEWCREFLFTGFPWLLLGYSQLNTPLAGWAPLIGVFGISWIIATTAGGIVFFWGWVCSRQLKNKTKYNSQGILGVTTKLVSIFAVILIIWLSGYMLKKIQWTHPEGEPISVSLVQGNIPQTLKWETQQTQKTLMTYERLTRSHWDSQLIIWPEAAVTIFQTDAADYLEYIHQLAIEHHSGVITGIPIVENNQSYNGMVALGNAVGSYKKRHLVPFGEFIPLRFLLDWLNGYMQIPMSDFSRGSHTQTLIQVYGIPVATFICYEIAYPDEVLDALPEGKLLVVVSDDSWFGKSIAPAQHLQIAQMRALETGRYLVMGTNDGVTAIVNPQGKIEKIAPRFVETVLSGKVQPMSGMTPWILIGFYPVMGVILLLLILAFYFRACLQRFPKILEPLPCFIAAPETSSGWRSGRENRDSPP